MIVYTEITVQLLGDSKHVLFIVGKLSLVFNFFSLTASKLVELRATKINAFDRIYEIFEKSFKLTNVFQRIHTFFIWTGLLSNIYNNLKKQPAEVSLTKKLPGNIQIALLMNICKFAKTGFDLPIYFLNFF